MTFVPRKVQLLDQTDFSAEKTLENLEQFRKEFAWVLLGEPGAGKTSALRKEAEETGGIYLRVAEFINCDLEPAWNNKILFLDGLDETRANGKEISTLLSVKQQLKKLGNPLFRIACRAADWYGKTDEEDLKAATPNQKITRLQLEPLEDKDILNILQNNHNTPEPEDFLEKAKQHGIADLLTNPQTLGLIAKAVSNDKWPNTRNEVFQLACKELAREANKDYRDQKRANLLDEEKILAAAGQLYAVLLLSNKIGLALDETKANEHFIELDNCKPPDAEAATTAIHSKLFRLEEQEERIVPYHRSIAEYLAAKWLADQIDKEGFPSQRLFNILFGTSDRVIAGLRGLYGWLALHCHTLRKQLIVRDPLTIIIYGDTKPIPLDDKRQLLKQLRTEAEKNPYFYRETRAEHSFGALAVPELHDEYLATLQLTNRDEASQAYVYCVLTIISQNNIFDFYTPLLDIIKDDSHELIARSSALNIWLKKNNHQLALTLLNDVTNGRILDRNDELAGILLDYLYPKYIAPEDLFKHLHPPKDPNLIGSYAFFWIHKLVRKAPKHHLSILMNQLEQYSQIDSMDIINQSRFKRMAGSLLLHSIKILGDTISDDCLYKWLGIDTDSPDESQSGIKKWLEERPEKYKALLCICFKECEKCENHEHNPVCIYRNKRRLRDTSPPKDIGFWYLNQIPTAFNEEWEKLYFFEGIKALEQQYGTEKLSWEYFIEVSKTTHPKAKEWFDGMKHERIDWQNQMLARQTEYEQKQDEEKQKRANRLIKYLPTILNCTAPAGVLYELAGVWKKRFLEVHGNTITKRFENFYGNSHEIQKTATIGFELCPFRADLPTVTEIIKLNVGQKEHLLSLPCLIGIELLWKNDKSKFENLPQDILSRIIAFQLTYMLDKIPDWFTCLAKNHPDLIAEILVLYIGTKLKAGSNFFINCINLLNNDSNYREVTIIAVPALLKKFPVRALKEQLSYLKHFLKAAFHYMPEILPAIVKTKITKKSMDTAQKIYWHTINAVLNPQKNQAALWRCVGKTEICVGHLADFLRDWKDNPELSVSMMGKLIELMTPYAEIESPGGASFVSDARFRGYQVQNLIARLGALLTNEATQELKRLIKLDELRSIKPMLEIAHHEQELRQRENKFSFLEATQVAQILANKEPASTADLAALALDVIDSISNELHTDNDTGIRHFWNVDGYNRPTEPRPENSCRDILLRRIKYFFEPKKVNCMPEGSCNNDKYADIHLSYNAKFELSIEIKCNDNPELWSGLKDQLINQYAPGAEGYGIYLVLWFGGKGLPNDNVTGGKKPRAPKELKERLEAQLSSDERKRIFIRVLDLSGQK